MMVPLTESLYVSGQVHEPETVLVDIGAGYYAEVRIFRYLADKCCTVSQL
jgi:prefoldin subunit 5